jgi:hypothetical protein
MVENSETEGGRDRGTTAMAIRVYEKIKTKALKQL